MYGKMPLAEILPEIRKTGATAIDLWPEVHGNQREQVEAMGHEAFLALLETPDVDLGILTRYDLGPFKLEEEIKAARSLGASMIVTGSKHAKGGSLKAQVRQFVDDLAPQVAQAEAAGVTLAIENHGNALIESPDSLRYFAEYAESPYLGIAFAPYHLPQDPAIIARLIRDLGPKLVHFYAWEHGHGCHEKRPKVLEMKQLPGYGPLDFTPILAALRDVGYCGYTSIFMHPVPRGIPILPEAGEVTAAINRSRAYLEYCLEKQR